EPDGFALRTRILVIAAGSLGSTELLMRASAGKLRLSRAQLGQRFSSNGDTISAVYGMQAPVQAIANEDTPYALRQVGPTITRMVDRRHDPQVRFVVQDLAIPGPLRRLLQEVVSTSAAVGALTRFNHAWYADPTAPDAAGIDEDKTDRTMVVAVIGSDDATGQLGWAHQGPQPQAGTLTVVWKALRDDPGQNACQDALERMAAAGHPSATVIANPAWRPLPKSIASLLDGVQGTVLTTHPLGGCSMADDAAHGVVNDCGQVFQGASGTAVHDDLLVLDGSVIPTALGINPALTIATLTRRAMRELRDKRWKFLPVTDPDRSPRAPRPAFRDPGTPQPQPSTRIELNECMVARATIRVGDQVQKCRLELRLQFEPQEVASLIGARSARTVTLNPQRSVLRLMATPSQADVEPVVPSPPTVDGPAPRPLLEIPLSGQMRMLRMAPSLPLSRTLVALLNWLRNRALRDLFALLRFDGQYDSAWARACALGRFIKALPGWAWSAIKLASHAGNRRELQYQLMLGQARVAQGPLRTLAAQWSGSCISVTKVLTYELHGNPVNQFTFARDSGMDRLAGLQLKSALRVDYTYFARIAVPLLRIESQANQPSALVDLASLGLYLARAVLPLHAWSFRLSDRPRPPPSNRRTSTPVREQAGNSHAHRLPGPVPGLPVPQVVQLPTPDGPEFRLTRYCAGVPTRSTVLLIHGYSASGTTFAHRLLPDGGLAASLARAGHDAWVIDLRSSCGMPTAQEEWRFEDMGCQDIPLAIAHIVNTTHAEKIDVVAHCMGAAMLSLGLFGEFPKRPGDPRPSPDQCALERRSMPGRINRIVFSQVGPAVVLSPTNTARAYLFSWLRHFFKLQAYQFLPDQPDKSDDMLDRLLNLVPYPREDFARENPFWLPGKRTAWVVPRHRMDALYGVTFNLQQMGDDVLEAIDDFFGPLHLETVAQVIAFARNHLVTDRSGSTTTVVASVIHRTIGHCQVLCLHSEENVLADVSSRQSLLRLLEQAGLKGLSVRLQSLGHQDSLIGIHADRVYQQINAFLQ
ncbi:MAG: GMC oxidoreductase, partial [Burkholderiaceae bacterium]